MTRGGARRAAALRAAGLVAAAALLAPLVAGPAGRPPELATIFVRHATGPADVATGFATAPGRVLTVAHVVERGGRVEVRAADGRRRPATVVAIDRELDLALLRVPGLTAAPLRAGRAGGGTRLLVNRAGAPQARPAPVRRRIRARMVDQPGAPLRPALELAAEVAIGDSGAPVVDRSGRLAGVLYARSGSRAGTAYAVRGPGLAALTR